MAGAIPKRGLFERGGSSFHVSLDMFFDRDRVINSMDRKTNRVLAATGAFARTAMQRGMRRRKGVSPVGEFPSARPGNSLLRDKIRFGMSKSAGEKGVIVGPALLDKQDAEVAAAGKTVPELVNFGGVVKRRKVYDAKAKAIRPLRRGRSPVLWQYRPRPFVELTRPIAVRKLAENMERFDWS